MAIGSGINDFWSIQSAFRNEEKETPCCCGAAMAPFSAAIFRAGFPDLQCTIEDEINQGDRLAVLWTMRGTHKGMFQGNQPTGKPIEVQGIIHAMIEAGKIKAYWMLIDQFGMLQQLGLIPR